MKLGQSERTTEFDAADQTGDSISDNIKLGPGEDEGYMARALQLARKGAATCHPNPAVGCVIVNHGETVGEGWHDFAGQAHAEINALKQAGKASAGATMYVTLEPCSHHGKTPPCVKSIIKSRISRIVIAVEDPNPLVNRSGISELQGAGIDVTLGVGQAQAKTINRGFLKRITTGIPWVTLKIATSMDGKTAMADGESQWITSPPARQDAQKLRAAASGILTGIGSVLRDDPNMNARLDGVQRQPLRIILDTNLSTPVDARILGRQDGVMGDVLIVTANSEDSAAEIFQNDSVEIINCRTSGGKIDLNEVMLELGRREMNTILLEAGARLSGSMLEQGLVDEIVVYMAPDLLGSDAMDMFTIPGLEQLADKLSLEYKDVTRVGRDLRLTLSVAK
ncbi:bifunctional diaminohydroxyphosphoribosylaminopyrimidine deaminase/5-amino-6-(5-phosphoribosylamino)uracil reductase RibD [Candidatus Spongiihabitans sp.]|uniref:bifunctional diaminohydroxyphosphoribosylaminopyrimidine deaminase/5-amino-6-(5-phosphoribosylamino)uracil reductase RibD n=1 Tax=Candidatus Spongiihabitans sp. TaxID=3101308 RepID=UPI003C6F6F14